MTAPAHALNDGNSPYTRADRARGSRPVFVLYERHPVHGLINRPLGRFLGGEAMSALGDRTAEQSRRLIALRAYENGAA